MTRPLHVIFYWHMHQPFYREAESNRYHLPWVYLHAIKGYTDMATILDQVPGARAAVNFVPSLSAQIDDYARRIRLWLDGRGELPDPLLQALGHPDGRFDGETRRYLLRACFRLNHERNLHRHPEYSRLWHIAGFAREHGAIDYLGDNYYADLVTWYHLAWLGETVRQQNFVARRLIDKGRDFDAQDRRDLMTLVGGLTAELAERYRKLEEHGKIELSTTPYAHPILPLLLDFGVARETVHDAVIPEESYPGGEARGRDHVERAIEWHEAHFGRRARGCWPAEGGVSEAALRMLAEAGFSWCATGEGVLHHSLGRNLREPHAEPLLYEPWLVGDGERKITCFFRDDRLSDLIGFEYANWETEDAVANLVHELTEIHRRTLEEEAPVVVIAMDGENAWEHYHENGLPFLTNLYQTIAEHPDLALTTFCDYLDAHPARRRLDHLVPGSWVYGNFATWIGDPDKTRGWELLIEAKHAFDDAVDAGELEGAELEAAVEQLRICEGSDWCWWFGDYNPGAAVRDFDALYRHHLRRLYELVGRTAPPSLDTPISRGSRTADGGAMRRTT